MMTALILLSVIYVALLALRSILSLSYEGRLPEMVDAPLPERCLSILQPILSGDPHLESCLQATLEHADNQQIVWLVDIEDVQGNQIVDSLQDKYPHAHIRIISCPPCPDATNPKLWKLRLAASSIETPYFCVLDDDTTLSIHSAAILVEAASKSSIATGLPYYRDDGRFASGLLAQFVNNNSIFTYMGTSRLISPMTINGMGYVLRTIELEKLDSFKPILHELTDDFSLASLVLNRGGTIHQSNAPLCVQTSVRNMSHYMQMMHRWYVFTILLLKHQSQTMQVLIFLLHGLSWKCARKMVPV